MASITSSAVSSGSEAASALRTSSVRSDCHSRLARRGSSRRVNPLPARVMGTNAPTTSSPGRIGVGDATYEPSENATLNGASSGVVES
jgi:hypothetical protein